VGLNGSNKQNQFVTNVSEIEKKDQMKAIVYTRNGSPDILQLAEVEKPAPKDHQLLIKVHAASANALDYHLMRGMPVPFITRIMNRLRKPKQTLMGVDLAGRVEAVGSAVTQFKPGDEVFGMRTGAFAEYVCAREDAVVLKPTNVTFEAAAAVPVAALTALQGLRDKGKIQPGQKVLISGASGGVGTFAVQIAKAFGTEVTAMCSTRNLDMVCSLGADRIIDYTREDVTRSGQRYDLILAVNGYYPILAYRRALSPAGIFVMVGASKSHLLRGLFEVMLLGSLISKIGRQKYRFCMSNSNHQDLVFLKELLEAGKLRSVIDKCYPLGETAEAIRYMEEVHARGKVVIMVV
jgi:NADPH:quinone reductase-like Zn-dependent oxidoreductase